MNKILCLSCDQELAPRIEDRLETYPVRGEAISVNAKVAVCTGCGEDIDVEELDEASLRAAFDEYRRRHHLMTPDEMRSLRSRYGLGVRAFALLLGWGELTLHRYESGSLQDDAHETQLRMATSPENMRTMLEKNGHKLTARQRATVEAHLAAELGAESLGCDAADESFLVRENQDQYGGWREQELSKLREMMLFFSALPSVYPTKLNKLLFYADFLHFELHAISVTGTPYLAFQHGPVPAHYDRLLADMFEGGDLTKEEVDFPDGSGGERLHPEREPDLSLFAPAELETMRRVADELGHLSSKQLRDRSHAEKAWAETPAKAMISYDWARDLTL